MVRGPTPPPFVVDVLLLTLALTCILAAQVLLPALSLDYGVLRSLQQVLLVSGVVVVWGAQLSTPRRRTGMLVPTVVLLGYFAVASGLVSQVVGGYSRPALPEQLRPVLRALLRRRSGDRRRAMGRLAYERGARRAVS